ncbi:MAG: hypothetical protein QNJ55_13550 [Xenococcus sp. MO_188.B8]|nr:hypothetical protein [Xenococcus sp. MO_188.B8]
MKPINDYPGYAVCLDGSIHSLARIVKTKNGRKRQLPYRKLTQYRNPINGKYYVTLCNKGVCKSVLVSRLVADAYFRTSRGNYYILHRDGDELNNAANNLVVQEVKRGNTLTASDVADIRLKLEQGILPKIIAKQFNVSLSHIYNICSNRTWKTTA